jgi:uncharacterized protein (DUF924 family)
MKQDHEDEHQRADDAHAAGGQVVDTIGKRGDLVIGERGHARPHVIGLDAIGLQARLNVGAIEQAVDVIALSRTERGIGGEHPGLRRQRQGERDHEHTGNEAANSGNHGHSGKVIRKCRETSASLTFVLMANYHPDDVLDFRFGTGADYGKRDKRWFEKNSAFDAEVTRHFLSLYEERADDRRWLDAAKPCLARIIVLDQFPRQMFRGNARAFAADSLALESARSALDRGYDGDLLPVERVFVYLPFEHSEALADQLRACELTEPLARFPETEDVYRYALAHRDIISRFGRFPHRNAILGRVSTPEEIEFLKQPGSSF